MTLHEPMQFMPLDLDTFSGSERFMTATQLGAAFGQGIRAYLHARYAEALEHFQAALIAAYVEGEAQAQIYERERAIIHLYSGNALAFQGEWASALQEYLKTLAIDHTLAEAHYNLGAAFAALGQLDRAIATFKAALEHNPQLYEAHFALGRSYQRLDDAGRAYIHYQGAREARPQAAEPVYYMGLMHQSHGAHELAQRCFGEALRIEPTFVSPENDPALINRSEAEVLQWYYRLGDDLKLQGCEADAERIYQALLQWRPHEHQARYLLGNLLARTKRWEQALLTYNVIPPDDRHYVEARVRMSMIERILHHPKHAYTLLFECARLHPDNGYIFLNMAKLLHDMNKPRAAVRACERAVQLLPNDAQAHYLLGLMYTSIGNEQWALAAWRKAVALAPEAHSLRFDLGALYVRCGRYDLALHEFTTLLQHWPDDIETNFMLALCYKELLDPMRAIPLFEKVLRRNPRHAQALYYLGACYLQIGNTSLGKAYLRRYDHMLRQARGGVAQARTPGRALSMTG
jgi:tetratricopeptide (TPR) repeat protein